MKQESPPAWTQKAYRPLDNSERAAKRSPSHLTIDNSERVATRRNVDKQTETITFPRPSDADVTSLPPVLCFELTVLKRQSIMLHVSHTQSGLQNIFVYDDIISCLKFNLTFKYKQLRRNLVISLNLNMDIFNNRSIIESFLELIFSLQTKLFCFLTKKQLKHPKHD